jgi:hypothetical protein
LDPTELTRPWIWAVGHEGPGYQDAFKEIMAAQEDEYERNAKVKEMRRELEALNFMDWEAANSVAAEKLRQQEKLRGEQDELAQKQWEAEHAAEAEQTRREEAARKEAERLRMMQEARKATNAKAKAKGRQSRPTKPFKMPASPWQDGWHRAGLQLHWRDGIIRLWWLQGTAYLWRDEQGQGWHNGI